MFELTREKNILRKDSFARIEWKLEEKTKKKSRKKEKCRCSVEREIAESRRPDAAISRLKHIGKLLFDSLTAD